MNCDDCQARLGEYLDGELSGPDSEAITKHLQSCGDCAQALERQRALRTVVKQHLLLRKAPDALHAAIQRAAKETLAPESKLTSRRWLSPAFGGRIAAAAAVILIVAAGTWSVAMRRADADKFASDVFTSHVRSLMGSHLTDVPTSDQHTVKPWFDGKLDYAPPVYDFAGKGYPLVGGRLDYLAGRSVAALVYGRRQHVINVFVWPADPVRAGGAPATTKQGYNMLHWSTAQYTYWVVSDLGTAELTEFSQLLRQADAAAERP